MEIVQLTAQNIMQGFAEIISNKKECFVYGIPDNNYVFTGTTNMCNCEYCEEHGIRLLPIPNEGGVIVLSKGDVEIGIFKYNGWDVCKRFMELLCEKLKERIPTIKVHGNDLIIDDIYKCVGSSSRNLGDAKNPYLYTAAHISLNVDLELIRHICKKPMNKIPKGLSEYGYTTEELERIILEINEVIDNAS